jgi:hypothetical protein
MSWQQVHRRHRLVDAALADVARSGRPVLGAARRREVDAEYGELDGFLRDVQQRWFRAFDARLDAVLERDPADLPAALAELWHELAEQQPAVRLLLDAHAGHPVLTELAERHDRALHRATGVRLDPARLTRPAPALPTQRRPPRHCALIAAIRDPRRRAVPQR